MDFLSRLNDELKKQNMTFASLERDLGLGQGTIRKWNKNFPSYDKVIKVANLLNVNLEWLLTGKEPTNSGSLSKSEQYILSMYSSLNEKNRNKIEGMLELLCSDEKNKQDEKGTSLPVEKEPETKNLQILGYTAAGSPIEMPVDPYSFSDLTTVPVGVNADFALQVTGDSMEPTILNNSIICIKKQPEVANGQIAVISLNNTVTCKRFYRDNGNIKLLSDNPSYEPIIIKEQDEIEVHVIGKVVK